MIKKLYYNTIVRYIFFGGLTTLVNIGVFFVLGLICEMTATQKNLISIPVSILFAYVVNARYVFESEESTIKSKFEEFLKFISSRIGTMIIEIVGVYILVDILNIQEMVSKVAINILVIVLNYVFSKVFVFTKTKQIHERTEVN